MYVDSKPEAGLSASHELFHQIFTTLEGKNNGSLIVWMENQGWRDKIACLRSQGQEVACLGPTLSDIRSSFLNLNLLYYSFIHSLIHPFIHERKRDRETQRGRGREKILSRLHWEKYDNNFYGFRNALFIFYHAQHGAWCGAQSYNSGIMT